MAQKVVAAGPGLAGASAPGLDDGSILRLEGTGSPRRAGSREPVSRAWRSRAASNPWSTHRPPDEEEPAVPLTNAEIDAILQAEADHECPGVGERKISVKIVAIADLPSRFGHFQIVAFWNNRDGKEHAAFVHGDIAGQKDVPVRMHSECLTGDAIGSLRCDCRDQLEAALRVLSSMDRGLLLYLRQEGRGIGFTNKIRAYGLQDYGYDTVEANIALGFRDDERDYSVAAHMLWSLHVVSVRLMTNNPRKIDGLVSLGIRVSGRIPLVVPPNDYNRFYLETKARKSGHLLDVNGKEHLLEQIDRPVIDGMTSDQAALVQED